MDPTGPAAEMTGILTPAVLEWAERTAPGARLTGCTVRPLPGGAVARRVERLTWPGGPAG